MEKFDLIPNPTEMEFLFVLESPHTEELEMNLPCVGKSGTRMANEIFPQYDKSFGEILKSNIDEASKFGIMNSFQFPLQITSKLTRHEKHFHQLTTLKWIKGKTKREEFYDKHFKILRESENTLYYSNFSNRLSNYVQGAPKLKLIVFFGYISQSMYLHCFNLNKIPPYNKKVSIPTESGREIHLLFVNHPSEKNEKWDFNKRQLDFLKT